ncbi:FxsA family protein [Pseudocolwellia sp. AS88]|uniref:FxsA family protein n=1 Tax=Pseudocolwellia sp. AS88 TaxID=3063958 RepID=UPI0026F20DA9|nr:FxsA family protein [Pseudocolwellia sp. AS88]MDO7084233.1 FxsA family protein [Pseudocolwellia sp. AS88]
MFRFLFLLFIIIPIIEITLLINIGEVIGAWPTIAIVIITAWLGAKNVRQQGLATMQSVQTKMAQGEMPSAEIVTGLMLMVAGVLLVTPGFVTDILGLLLLVPSVRKALGASVQKHLHTRQGSTFGASAHFHSSDFSQGGGNVYENEMDNSTVFTEKEPAILERKPHKGETIEGDFERKDE